MNENPVRKSTRKLSRDTVSLVGDLLPLLDFFGVLLAAWLATLLLSGGDVAMVSTSDTWKHGSRAALAAALLAPLILCDRAFVSFASGGQTAALIRCYTVRFAMFAGVVAVLGLASRSLEHLPGTWLALWLLSSVLVTAIVRTLLVANLRRLERNGVLTETIAVVGAGAGADRLIERLRQTRGVGIDVLGVFDDRVGTSAGCRNAPVGSVADLIEFGKSHPMDWILIAAPGTAEQPTQALVHRLKALAVPIGLYPQQGGADDDAATPQAARADSGWHTTRAALTTVLPIWVLTLLSLPLAAYRGLIDALRARQPRLAPLKLALDDYDLDGFSAIAARFGQHGYGYVVTPNADHLIRLHREAAFRASYADAAYVLLDSRFIAHLLRATQKRRLPVCTGSDLTARLLDEVVVPEDRIVLIGGSERQAADLSARYGLKNLLHFNPPMGFIHDAAALETCLRFVEAHSPFRYCLLAVGAPQQETVAQQLKVRGVARGLALCIGASINFLTGDERRAPQWMQRSGIEWLYRLLQAPSRMAQRYLVRGPQLFGLLRRTEIVLRAASASMPMPSSVPKPALAMLRRPVSASLTKRLMAPRAVRRAISHAAWVAKAQREAAPAP